MDDNFQLRSMRKDVHRVCQQALTSNRRLILYFVILWLDTPFNICLERNEKRPVDRRVPEEVIYNIHRSWEPPDADKASWEVNHCRLSEVTTIDDIGRYLQSSAFQPVQPPPPDRTESQQAEREKTRANVLHQCDGFLRTFVGCVAKIHRGSVQDANQARKKILQDLKNEQNETTVLSSCSPYDDLTELFLKELLANNHDDDFWTEHRIKDLRSSIHNAHNQQY
jgi:tRNA uridine 5-carbamoylmethylation protein Kti12